MRLFSLSAVATLSAALMGTATASIASDFDQRRLEVSTRIDAYMGGFHVAEVDLTTKLDNGSYQMESRARTLGLADMVVKGHATTTVEGELSGTIIKPARFLSTYGGRWGDRRAEMEFDDQGPTKVTAIPSYDQDQRKQVPMDQRAGTIDPLSAALFSVTFASSGKMCEGAVRVFDGRRRYDLTLEYLGEDELRGRADMAYQGKATKCRVHQDRITGFWEGEIAQPGAMRRSAKPRIKRGDTPATVWIGSFEAPDGGAPILMPVKVQIDTDWGHMLAHMTRVDMKPLEPKIDEQQQAALAN